MRKLFMDELDIKSLVNPVMKTGIYDLRNPERLLSPNSKIYKYPESYVIQPFDTVSPLNCNLLLLDKNHDGIWLLINNESNSLTLPGGRMNEDSLYDIGHGEPVSAIYDCIIDYLIGTNPCIGDEYDYITNLNDKLDMILKAYGLKNLNERKYSLAYSYYNKNQRDELNIYVILEVDNPSTTIEPLSCYEYYRMIWYTRKDHLYNKRTLKDRHSLFCSNYKYDIRTDSFGITILDNIFSNKKLFGNLDIY